MQLHDRNPIATGLGVAVLLHIFVVSMLLIAHATNGNAQPTEFARAEIIEASLAFKEVKAKDNQPQKRKKQKFSRNKDDAASRADMRRRKKEKKKKSLLALEKEIDIESVLRKNRKQDSTRSDTGVDELPTPGSAQESEWGTEIDAQGDPYVGELKGRIYAEWKVPALETSSGDTIGCVRLDKEGAIVAREVKTRSKNINLNRSVEVALNNATDMETPVPPKLQDLLIVQGVCFKFSLD